MSQQYLHIRDGRIEATIWANVVDEKPLYRVTFSRSYKDAEGTFYPGIPGRPTQWDCVQTISGGTSCTTIEIVCVGNTTECYARQVTCYFEPNTPTP